MHYNGDGKERKTSEEHGGQRERAGLWPPRGLQPRESEPACGLHGGLWPPRGLQPRAAAPGEQEDSAQRSKHAVGLQRDKVAGDDAHATPRQRQRQLDDSCSPAIYFSPAHLAATAALALLVRHPLLAPPPHPPDSPNHPCLGAFRSQHYPSLVTFHCCSRRRCQAVASGESWAA
ncbi:hypothetical protein NHX12_019242 [Muraenolepis orangiensis]|uniref:Uncharacterized protein n=1 Tax=Muraenolepis orangiensis TaxID=630683 RepID=A0A9Q0IWF4_9TELE|nr:hypothetical protein NHX12_019242 [Muraenolepis orangiensis]